MLPVVYNLVAVVCAFLLSYAFTPTVRVLAFKIGAVDIPLDERRMHNKPIPRIGGLAIYLSFTLTTLFFCEYTSELLTICVGGAALVAIGIFDDVYRLNPFVKLLVQVLVAVFAVVNGCVIDHITLGGTYVDLGVFSVPLSIFWIVGLTNSINFIDGLDGLACGVSAISSLSLLVVVFLHGDLVSTLLCGIIFGACIGFLPFNSNPARIFMGDTGALFLGYVMSILSIQGVFKLHAVLSFIVPLIIFALPLFDTLFAILRRVFSGKSPFAADRGHIHHRLIDMGFAQKDSVKLLYAISGILGLVAIFCTDYMFSSQRVVKSVGIAFIAVFLFAVNYLIIKNPESRKHSGISPDDMTVSDYIHELDPEKVKKIEDKNGITVDDIEKADRQKSTEKTDDTTT